MKDMQKLNRMYDDMMNDLNYSKIAAFTKIFHMKEKKEKQT